MFGCCCFLECEVRFYGGGGENKGEKTELHQGCKKGVEGRNCVDMKVNQKRRP